MNRVAAFVDAGYFWIQCSHILFHERRNRSYISLDPKILRTELLQIIQSEFPQSHLLRIYWYDGLSTGNAPSKENEAICQLDDFKMRYGTINSANQQKGVDGLLIADLIGLAQNKAITSALIISGDADLAPGVAAAQTLGIRVHRLEIYGKDASSPILRHEVDKNTLWPTANIKNFISSNTKDMTPPMRNQKTHSAIERNSIIDFDTIAQSFLTKIPKDTHPTSTRFDKDFDGPLLRHGAQSLNKDKLSPEESITLRDCIRKHLQLK